MAKPRVVITQGDPAGVGPEIIAKTFMDAEVRARATPIVIGDASTMRRAVSLLGLAVQVVEIGAPEDADDLGDLALPVIDLELGIDEAVMDAGAPTAAAGQLSAQAIHRSIEIVMAGRADAIASAPVNKVALHSAGYLYPGQTEMFAEGVGTPKGEYHTMLIGGDMRVSLVTSHMSLRNAIDNITKERVKRIAHQAVATLHDRFGIDAPSVGVAGLNPHAGDGGLFGDEEIREIQPAIEELRSTGVRITNPRPADTLFWEAEKGQYDVVLGMYHDQGVIPLKRYGYVTLIAGIPIIRTTCGHGTAYDIAWKGAADHDLFRRAFLLAAELAAKGGSSSNA